MNGKGERNWVESLKQGADAPAEIVEAASAAVSEMATEHPRHFSDRTVTKMKAAFQKAPIELSQQKESTMSEGLHPPIHIGNEELRQLMVNEFVRCLADAAETSVPIQHLLGLEFYASLGKRLEAQAQREISGRTIIPDSACASF